MNKKFVALVVVAIVLVAAVAAVAANTKSGSGGSDKIDLVSSGNYLKIFGNANGDHLIDETDVNIIQDYINGDIKDSDLIRVTEEDNGNVYYLADANLDGTVDEKDISYLRGIIDRTGEEMSLIDTFGHLVTVPMTSNRIICDYFATAELLMLVGVQDKIVGASNALMVLSDYYLQGADLDNVVNFYSRTAPDYEAVAEANPDIWVVSEDYAPTYGNNVNCPVVGLDSLVFDFEDIYSSSPIMSALLAGYIFNNVDKAIEYVNWYLEKWDMLYSVTSQLSDDEKPTVFCTGYDNHIVDQSVNQCRVFLSNTVPYKAVELAGGKNIIDDCSSLPDAKPRPTSNVNMELEWISEQKYDYMFVHCTKYTGSGGISSTVPDHGYTCHDSSEYRAAQDGLGDIVPFSNSCDPDNMYLMPGDYMNGASGGILSAIEIASVIHPDLFPDLDVLEEQQEYIDLMGFDYDVHQGVFFLENA